MTGNILGPGALGAPEAPAEEAAPPAALPRSPAAAARRRAGALVEGRAGRATLVVLLLLVCALQLRGVLRSAYSNDDVANSQLPMVMRLQGQGIWAAWRDQTRFWRDVHGRFFPLSGLETILVFTWLSTRAAYKVFQVVAAVAALGVFVLFVRRFTGELWAALVAGLVAVAAMQVRAWNDPWLQYNAQQPTALVLVLAAFGGFVAFARTGRWRWLAAAVVPWAVVLMVYETTWAFVLLFPLLAWGGAAPRRRRVVGLALMAVPILVLGAYVASLRGAADDTTASYTTSLSPGRVAPALVDQLTATLPLSYSALGPAPAERPWSADALRPDAVDLLVVAATVALVAVALPRVGALDRVTRWQLAGMGLALWVLPAGVVATTVRWQDELVRGLGYVSVYVQTFGLALVVVALVAAWRARRRRFSTPVVVVLAVAMAAALVATEHTTQRSVDALQSLRWDREVLADAVRHGLLQPVQPGEGVLSLRLQGFTNQAFVDWYGGPGAPVSFDPPPGCRPLAEACLTAGGFAWAMTPEYGAGPHSGHVLLAPLDGVVTEGTDQTVVGSELRAYVRVPTTHDGRDGPPALEVRTAPGVGDPLVARRAQPGEVRVDAVGSDWWLLTITPASGVIDAAHLELP
jgi:hypothetical protein